MGSLGPAGSPAAVLIEGSLAPNTSIGAWESSTSRTESSTADLTQAYVRRPTRGIQLKREAFATLAVTRGTPIKNSSAPPGTTVSFTSNFLLQHVQESRQEKFQSVTTFGATYGFFFGEQPRFVNCQAVLLNTADFQWEVEWWSNYEEHVRGTRAVDRGARVTLTYEDVLLEGYIISADVAKSEPNTWAASLSFSMWVVAVHYLIDVGARSIDALHSSQGPTEWDDFDYDVAGAPTMLQEVRQRNLAKLAEGSGSGLLGAIRGAIAGIDEATGRLGAVVGDALDWLYGRNMVIPAGFAGSERTSGLATFADGSGLVTLPNGQTGGSVTIRAPIRVAAVVPAKGSFFEDNVDEYPTRFHAGVQLIAASPSDFPDPSIAFAEQMFSSFGINITNDEGQSTSEVLRALGRVTFGALSYAATGASAQDAAALAETATSPEVLAASAEQAAAEALFR